ncbi:hypothetical protein MAUB1S_11389 [Mycolicibacterium aubagnense]
MIERADLTPKLLAERAEANAEMLTAWWVEKTGEPDSRGMWKQRALAAERQLSEAVEQPPAFDPMNGGCLHCKWLDTNLGRVLDKRCELHQKIEDMEADQQIDRQVQAGTARLLHRICEAMGADDEDGPVEIAKARIEELREAEEAAAEAIERAEKAERERDEARSEVIAADVDRSAAKTAQALCVRRAEAAEAEVARLRKALEPLERHVALECYDRLIEGGWEKSERLIQLLDGARSALQGEPS